MQDHMFTPFFVCTLVYVSRSKSKQRQAQNLVKTQETPWRTALKCQSQADSMYEIRCNLLRQLLIPALGKLYNAHSLASNKLLKTPACYKPPYPTVLRQGHPGTHKVQWNVQCTVCT
mmetsp:Transcript_11860/g.21786  ORF Transcript_11860/g.21786 Transcript_11860/m.21786 type:complete len:117 (+) Transcript_11860:919-1269(+)